MKLGQTVTDKLMLGRRDVFHVPAILTHCKFTLMAGDWVRFVDRELTEVALVMPPRNLRGVPMRHGIVDPFGPQMLSAGTLFWVLLQPELVDNMTHRFDVQLPAMPHSDQESSTKHDDWCKTECHEDYPEEDESKVDSEDDWCRTGCDS